jgi:nucleolar protein 56
MQYLFESSAGYALFERVGAGAEEVGDETKQVQKAVEEFGQFAQMVRLVSFQPFASAEKALENINLISEGWFFGS